MTADRVFLAASGGLLAIAGAIALLWLARTRPRQLLYLSLALLPTQFVFLHAFDFFVSPADVLVLASFAGLLWRLAAGKRSAWTALWRHRYLGVMLFTYLIGFVVLGVFSRTLVRPAMAILPSVLACELLRSRTDLIRAAGAIIAGGVLDAAYGLAYYASGTWLHPSRFSGIGGANFSAMVITSAAVMGCAVVARTSRPARLMGPGILTGLGLATLSQMGALALVLAWLTVLRLVVTPANKVRLVTAFAVVAALALSQPAVRDRLLDRNQREMQLDGLSRNSADVRLMVLRMVSKGISESPLFGVGYAQFQAFSATDPEIYASTGGTGYGTHNSYLEVLVEGGVLAFVPFLLHFVQFTRPLKLAFRALLDRQDVVVAACVAGLPVAIVCAALANMLLFYNFWAACGLALACGHVLAAEARSAAPAPVANRVPA
jgi:O-antigen ligase/polysaccharide polymerase Wzy-like membrane protein